MCSLEPNIIFYAYSIRSLSFSEYEPKDCSRSSKRLTFHAIFPKKVVLSNIIWKQFNFRMSYSLAPCISVLLIFIRNIHYFQELEN
jgi:hypothetical protein